jgi:hypothetical protein
MLVRTLIALVAVVAFLAGCPGGEEHKAEELAPTEAAPAPVSPVAEPAPVAAPAEAAPAEGAAPAEQAPTAQPAQVQ